MVRLILGLFFYIAMRWSGNETHASREFDLNLHNFAKMFLKCNFDVKLSRFFPGNRHKITCNVHYIPGLQRTFLIPSVSSYVCLEIYWFVPHHSTKRKTIET